MLQSLTRQRPVTVFRLDGVDERTAGLGRRVLLAVLLDLYRRLLQRLLMHLQLLLLLLLAVVGW